jgi:pyridoxamine 5'-phosphate oxidase
MPNDPDFTAATEPFDLFATWFSQAETSEPSDHNALSLATVDKDGLPNVRIVLLKGVDEPGVANRGFVFYTNYEGTKGRELLAQRKAAIAFHWKSLYRQVRVRGLVTTVSASEADAYFASRARDSRIGAWASQQSRPLKDRHELESAVKTYEAKFAGVDVPRPPNWSGFRLTPMEIEFWAGRDFRLHDRIVFRRDDTSAPWKKTRLYP